MKCFDWKHTSISVGDVPSYIYVTVYLFGLSRAFRRLG